MTRDEFESQAALHLLRRPPYFFPPSLYPIKGCKAIFRVGGNFCWAPKKKGKRKKKQLVREWQMKKRTTSTLLSTPSPLTGLDTPNVKHWWEPQLALFHTSHWWSSRKLWTQKKKWSGKRISEAFGNNRVPCKGIRWKKASVLFQRKLHNRQYKQHSSLAERGLKRVRISGDNEHAPHSLGSAYSLARAFLARGWMRLAVSVTRPSLFICQQRD